jgi:hypothetical protein
VGVWRRDLGSGFVRVWLVRFEDLVSRMGGGMLMRGVVKISVSSG